MYYFACPSCKSREAFSHAKNGARNDASAGCALWLLGGILPALLFLDSKMQKIRCEKCGFIFRKPPIPSTCCSAFSLCLLGLLIISIFVGMFAEYYVNTRSPEWLASGSADGWVQTSIRYLMDHPVMAVSTLLSFIIPAVILGIPVAFISHFRHRKRIQSEYEIHIK